MAKDFSEVTWREFFDSKRDKPGFHERLAERLASVDGLSFKKLGVDRWSFEGEEFSADTDSREKAFMYALYRSKVLDDGGVPSEYEQPTRKGW